VAQAGTGWGPAGTHDYYANSPSGAVPQRDTAGEPAKTTSGGPAKVNTGKALRKFVDTLPGLYIPGVTKTIEIQGTPRNTLVPVTQNNLGQYIPVAVAERWVDLNGVTTKDEYIEIAAIEYTEKMHSDLPKATRLRGYVQLSTTKNRGKHIALKYLDGSPILDNKGVQVYAYDNPHHLGPIIQATSGTAMRVKFVNLLPTGAGGKLFVPVDTTLTGAGVGPDGSTPYSENRAVVHLVSGGLPWISAGNPHQWIAPAGESNPAADGTTTGLVQNARGVSTQNVPDMADPGQGATTLYFPNSQSARFMFYHDRTSGLTRLNAYAGMEAGYFITDAAEDALINGGTLSGGALTTTVRVNKGTIPADEIPLIIEDKAFVPLNIAEQDAKWNNPTTAWGLAGDLWFPHVYQPNQDPATADGTNPVGRWDYGPLFWPIFPTTPVGATFPSGDVGDATSVPEAYLDTPVINGTAYPTLTVDPKAYRFRILNASNDRYLNLGLYRAALDLKADGTPTAPQLDANNNPILNATGAPLYFSGTEVKMIPALATDAIGSPPVPANTGVGGLAYDPTCLCQYPQLVQNNNVSSSGPSRAWPIDDRRGGVPDPTTVGPDIIAIGNDGGFLPNAVDIPSQPITYEANRRSITVNNAYGYGLLLGPAERSDAIIDFSAYAGQTLIVYNDAPAPFPFSDERNDYYSGNPDLTSTGGAFSTQPGYGPNTRTIMQIKVSNNIQKNTFSVNNLKAAIPAAYAATQPEPLVPQVIYNTAFGTKDTDVYAHISTGAASQPTLDFTTTTSKSVTLTGLDLILMGGTVGAAQTLVSTGSGNGYDPDPLKAPTVVFNNGNCLSAKGVSASAMAVVDPNTTTPVHTSTGQIIAITNFNAGSGYTCVPTVSFRSTAGIGAAATVKASVDVNGALVSINKSLTVKALAEQELFDDRGRYNKTGGVEMPFSNAINQTTIPLNYIDAATESIQDGETLVWKISVNGLFSNSLSFNLADVQLINRVGWDGTVKPPSSNEVGWKNTLRMNPLEDVVIAVRAKRAAVPFGLPVSERLRDPSKTLNAPGSGLGFTVNPNLNVARANTKDNYDNEFVWNSAMLSNSENDFMRPIVFHPTVTVPDAPYGLIQTAGTQQTTLTWKDPTPLGGIDQSLVPTLSNPKNEIGFKVVAVAADGKTYSTVAPVAANTTSWSGSAHATGTTYSVVAYNVAGDSDLAGDLSVPGAPTWLAADPIFFNSVTLNFADTTTRNRFEIWRVVGSNVAWPSVGGVPAVSAAAPWFKLATLPGSSTQFIDNAASAALYPRGVPAVSALQTYTYQIVAVNTAGSTPSATTQTVTTPEEPVAAPTNLVAGTPNAARNRVQVTLTWTDNATNETAYLVDVTANGVTTTTRLARNAVTATVATTPGFINTISVTAIKVNGTATSTSTAATTTVDLTVPSLAAPTNLALVGQTSTRATLSWAAVPPAVTVPATTVLYQVQVSTDNGATWANSGGPTNLLTATPRIAAGNSYQFQVLTLATRFGVSTTSTSASSTISVVTPPAASSTPVAAAGGNKLVTVNWTNTSTNITDWKVERQPNFGTRNLRVFSTIATTITGTYTFTDTVPNVGSYTYRVTAVNAQGNGPVATSNAVTAN
jgi:FtsP/CotA-like multicopper oxidase with cupredoxin domain